MSIILWENNANTTLAGSVSNVATTATLTPGAGALFPAPGAGEYFVATFTDAATGLLNEIVHVTNVTGDVATIVRAQEGTTALNWVAGDLFSNLVTAGTLNDFAQEVTLQGGSQNYAVDTGAANAYVAAFSPVVSAHVAGMPLRVKIVNTNTAASTFNDGAGVLAAVRPGGLPLHPYDLQAGGIYTFIYNGTNFEVAELAGAASTPAIRRPAALTVVNGGGATNLLPGLADVSADGLVVVESRYADAYPGTYWIDVLLVLGNAAPVLISHIDASAGGACGVRTYGGSPLTLALTGAVANAPVNVMVYGSGFSV